MEPISYKLEVFEGPLDLLLHLISKHKLNINDIPIMTLVEQYLDYISHMAEQDMEIAGEFLEMAEKEGQVVPCDELPKAFLLTAEYGLPRVHLTSLNVQTLERRLDGK